MRRALLISLSLVLVLVAWTAVCAEDNFYVIPAMKGKYAPVPKTGQTTPYVQGDDGYWHTGVAWPTPRFTDNNNGTVTDNLTGLIWLQNAGVLGAATWEQAVIIANNLKSGEAGLTDGSQAGDWRLPNLREYQSLIDYGRSFPALPENHPFTDVQGFYWSSTTAPDPAFAWDVFIGGTGEAEPYEKFYDDDFVWCVRGGR